MMVLRKLEGLFGGVLVCGLAWAGCGGSDPTLTLDEYFAQAAEVRCTKAFACCDTSEIDDVLGLFETPATVEKCIEQLSASFDASLDPIKDAVADGRLTFSPDRAEACTAKIKAASCVDYFVNRTTAKDPDCKGVIDPGVALGGACKDEDECKDEGAICVATVANDPATCRMPPGVGEPCVINIICAQGLYCAIDTSLCAEPGPVGAACYFNDECQSEFCNAGACASPLPTGASCINGGGCGSEGYCDTATFTCAAKKPDGAACESSGECMKHACTDKICGYAIPDPTPICDGL